MRKVTQESITDAVIASFAGSKDGRLKEVLGHLVRHLHAFARDAKLTHAEWKAAIDFLYAAGRISNDQRNEFMLTSDVLGLSTLVDLLNQPAGATESSELGPFYAEGSPLLPVGADLVKGNTGDRVLVRGRVLDTAGRPIAGALLDFWQAASNGLYPEQDKRQDPLNLRFCMKTDGEGRYAFTTIKPAAYTVPYDGPVGGLLRAGGRDAWRPAHFHFIVSADGHRPVVTELFADDDPYVERDAVFGVRESLIVRYVRHEKAADATPWMIAAPFYAVDFDFRLGRL
jgi:hydroxyquinol 1,2-dioxygenase